MKRTLSFLSAVVLGYALAGVAAAQSQNQSQNQSLGDYARAVKKTKPAPSSKSTPKVIDNDNLSGRGTVNVVGNPTDSDSANKDDKDETKTADAKTADAKSADASKTETKADKKEEPKLKPGQPAEERDKALEAVQHKLDAQKEKIALLSRELDVLQREYQLKVATFYSDPAKRVENPNGLFDDESKYKDQIAEKQKALEEANTQLTDMQDEARRAGAPSSVAEQ